MALIARLLCDLLKEQGHDLTAFYLKIWLEDELSYLGDCPWEEDLAYVRAVCEQAQVPLEVISLQKEYWDQVVSYTMAEIKAGRTPNPDILCNQRIKFGMFFNHINELLIKLPLAITRRFRSCQASAGQGWTEGRYETSAHPDGVIEENGCECFITCIVRPIQLKIKPIFFPI